MSGRYGDAYPPRCAAFNLVKDSQQLSTQPTQQYHHGPYPRIFQIDAIFNRTEDFLETSTTRTGLITFRVQHVRATERPAHH